jgi:hypothetical protein
VTLRLGVIHAMPDDTTLPSPGLPAPTPRERRHRSLARRLVAVRRRARYAAGGGGGGFGGLGGGGFGGFGGIMASNSIPSYGPGADRIIITAITL